MGVDHAGEMGASFIYQGQMAVLKNTKSRELIQEMWDHEKAHLAKFEELLITYKVRPTVLIPVWKLAGFTLGAGCSLLGEKGAMACTVAVEALVTKHYDDQVTEMVENNPRLDENLIELHGNLYLKGNNTGQPGDQEVPRRRAESPRHRACPRGRGGAWIQFSDCCDWIWM